MAYPHGCASGGQAVTLLSRNTATPTFSVFSKCWDYGTHWTRAGGHGW